MSPIQEKMKNLTPVLKDMFPECGIALMVADPIGLQIEASYATKIKYFRSQNNFPARRNSRCSASLLQAALNLSSSSAMTLRRSA